MTFFKVSNNLKTVLKQTDCCFFSPRTRTRDPTTMRKSCVRNVEAMNETECIVDLTEPLMYVYVQVDMFVYLYADETVDTAVRCNKLMLILLFKELDEKKLIFDRVWREKFSP